MNRLERMLKDFDENQLREINKFLNSADGRRLKSHINLPVGIIKIFLVEVGRTLVVCSAFF